MIERLRRPLKNQLLAIQGLKYGILRRRHSLKEVPIKLYWWHNNTSGITNFGDETTKDILLAVFGYRSIFASRDDAELIGAGSIIEIVSHRSHSNKIYVWGSGFMWRENKKLGSIDNLNFCAVRGALSRSRLGSSENNVALGDPGLLASIVYKKAKRKTDKIGVVVHYIDSNTSLVQKLKKDKRFIIIDPLHSPVSVARDITSCKLILSSSLHGLIFADSFNIPNIHIKLSNNVAGGIYKFEDYYSGTGRPYRSADKTKIFDSNYLTRLQKSYQSVVGLRKIQKELVRSFPKIR